MILFYKAVLEMIGDGVDLLFCNEDEARDFTGTDSAEAAQRSMHGKCVTTREAIEAALVDAEVA